MGPKIQKLMPKYKVGLKTCLLEDLTKLYGDFFYKFIKIVGKTDFLCNLKRLSLATKR